MSIQPKSVIKPLFVDGATPNGTAFQDWIDSCAFLNTDSSATLTSLRLPIGGVPANPPSGYKTLFFSSANSNNLYAINSSGVISSIAPTQYVSTPIGSTFRVAENVCLLVTKKAVKIKSIRASANTSGGTQTVDIYVIALPATIAGAALLLADTQTVSFIQANLTTTNMTLTDVNVPADYLIMCNLDNYSGTITTGALSIEYEEVN
jgi:hypothetical protein